MGLMYWFRVVLMVLSFVGTVLIIREFNRPPNARRAHFFGLVPGAAPGTEADVNLCPTRVTKLELEDGVVIREDGLTWVRAAGEQVTKLDQVAVEKWFSAYCRVAGQKVAASADVKTVLRVEFVTGEPQTLIRSAGGEYEWMGQPFASATMTEALAALSALR